MKWFKKNKQIIIDPYIENGNVHVNFAKCQGKLFVDLDVVILYLKICLHLHKQKLIYSSSLILFLYCLYSLTILSHKS